ncbi:unnamed protein product [Symbiodinium microadriaticum]|nr:unnamed protein product [Symbiodinium microadriaticum]
MMPQEVRCHRWPEYEDNGQEGKTLLKESRKGSFIPYVSPAARVDESALSAMQNIAGDLSEHLVHIEDTNYFTPPLNYTMPRRPYSEYSFEHLEDFVPNTDPSKFRYSPAEEVFDSGRGDPKSEAHGFVSTLSKTGSAHRQAVSLHGLSASPGRPGLGRRQTSSSIQALS